MSHTAAPLSAALAYAERGWPVVPLHTPSPLFDGSYICDCPKKSSCTNPGKHPRTIHGIDDATTDQRQIDRWWRMWPQANIAIHLQRAGLVDVAPDSIQYQAEFVAHGLPVTPSFRSGGGDGHEHYLYLRPDDCPPHRICRTGEYDLISNGYAVMPPSLHASGQRYTWLRLPEFTDPALAPEWAVRMLQEAARPRSASLNGAVAHDEDEPPVVLSGEALERWHGQAVSLKSDGTVDRSLSLVKIAGALAAAGATRTTIIGALQDRDRALGFAKYAGRRDEDVRYGELADDAIATRPSPPLIIPGGKVGAESEPEPEQDPAEAYAFTVYDVADFVNRDLPTIEWVVDDLLREQGIVGNFGGPGSLKTYFATQMGVCIALGCPFLGLNTRRARVLIVQEDTPEADYQQVYVRPMLQALNLDPEQLRGWLQIAPGNNMLFDNAERTAALDKWLTEFTPGVLILDAFYLLHQGEGMTTKDLGPILTALKRLRKKHACAIWIIDHNRKMSGQGTSADDLIDRWYGGRAKSAATDGAVYASKVNGQDDVAEYRVVKMRGGRKLLAPFQVQVRDGSLHLFTSADQLAESAREVYDWLCAQPQPCTVEEIVQGTGVSTRSVYNARGLLSGRGWLEEGPPRGKAKTWSAVRVAGLEDEV